MLDPVSHLPWRSVSSRSVTLRGFGKNLTDEFYVGGQFTASALVGSPCVYYGAPRMFGAEIQYRFGG